MNNALTIQNEALTQPWEAFLNQHQSMLDNKITLNELLVIFLIHEKVTLRPALEAHRWLPSRQLTDRALMRLTRFQLVTGSVRQLSPWQKGFRFCLTDTGNALVKRLLDYGFNGKTVKSLYDALKQYTHSPLYQHLFLWLTTVNYPRTNYENYYLTGHEEARIFKRRLGELFLAGLLVPASSKNFG